MKGKHFFFYVLILLVSFLMFTILYKAAVSDPYEVKKNWHFEYDYVRNEGKTTLRLVKNTTSAVESDFRSRLAEHKDFVLKTLRAKKKFEHVHNDFKVKANIKSKPKFKNKLEILCALKQVPFRTLTTADKFYEGTKLYPEQQIYSEKSFNTCAVVMNSASMINSSLGNYIGNYDSWTCRYFHFTDSHDLVVRLNHAITDGYEKDVGKKTDLRFVNSIIAAKNSFLTESLYSQSPLLIYDIPMYGTSLKEMLDEVGSTRQKSILAYEGYRQKHPEIPSFYLDPSIAWRLWVLLGRFSDVSLPPKAATTGFYAVAMMLHHCDVIHAFEYVPSMRISPSCHYWERVTELTGSECTFGKFHAISVEKLFFLTFNEASDEEVYSKGYITLRGLRNVTCPPNFDLLEEISAISKRSS